jgi:hypothetical protein
MKRQIRHLRQMRMLRRLSIGDLLLLVALITVFIAVIWIAVAPQLLDVARLNADEWSDLSAMVTVISFAFALGVGISILLQVSEANESRNLGIYQDIYEKLMASDEIEARRYIYQKLPEVAASDASAQKAEISQILAGDEKARVYIKQVLNLIDYFGFLVEQDWVTADEVIGWLSPVVVKVWRKIGPIVEYERSERLEEPDYYIAAVRLAEKCQQWRDQNLPGRQRDITFDEKRL